MENSSQILYLMYHHVKSMLDKIFALIILLVLFPLMILIALCYFPYFDVFFMQKRLGKNENEFRIFKFRTLVRKEGTDNEPRFVLGDILRKSSLDELPQLINVFKGEMSLIGPRPLLPEYLKYYTKKEKRRHQVKPGITGWAQVNGRNDLSWEEQFELDIYYVDNQSFRLDILIIFRTFIAVFQQKQLHQREKFHRTKDQNSEVGRNG